MQLRRGQPPPLGAAVGCQCCRDTYDGPRELAQNCVVPPLRGCKSKGQGLEGRQGGCSMTLWPLGGQPLCALVCGCITPILFPQGFTLCL